MDKNKETSNAFKNEYDDGNIPKEDLPQKNSSGNTSKDVIPDEVPRKDGPGGEGGR